MQDSVTRSRRASCLGLHTSLTIFDLERLDHQIKASPESQVILAEPSTLRLLGYKFNRFAVTSQILKLRSTPSEERN